MTPVIRQIALLVAKDLRIEGRNRHALGLVLILGLLIVVVLGLGLGPQQLSGGAAPAALWVAYLFGGVLCFEKTMAAERADGAMAGLMLAPIDRGVIYAGKLIANLALLLALVAVVTPVAILLFGFHLPQALLQFAAVMVVSMVGFAAVGTLFAGAVGSTRLGGGLLAMVLFPICLPLVITSTQIVIGLAAPGGGVSGSQFALLGAYDLIYLIVSWFAFELILEP